MDEIGDFGPYKFPTPFLPVELLSIIIIPLSVFKPRDLSRNIQPYMYNLYIYLSMFWTFLPYHFSDIFFLFPPLLGSNLSGSSITNCVLLSFNP